MSSASDDDARIARRLVAQPSRGSYVGLCVRVVPAIAREVDGSVVRTPEHFLAAAWPPAMHGFDRWPEAVVIGSPNATAALDRLLALLPSDARLYLASLDEVDGELAACIVLASDRNLEHYQRESLEAFALDQRERTQATILQRYTDRDDAFERFRSQVIEGTALPGEPPTSRS